MNKQQITFTGSLGDQLHARMDMPDQGEPTFCALFAHCFTCNKNLNAVGNITRTLTDHDGAVLRFDFTGLGESEGDFADTNFSSNIQDLLAAASHMREHYEAPSLLIGHSLGGAAVLQAAQHIPECKAVATIGAPSSPDHVTKLITEKHEEIVQKGSATVTLAGRPFTIKKQFLDDLEVSSMNHCIRTLDRALLVFHSPIDQTVGINNAAEIFKQAKHPKSFISLDDADHLLADSQDSTYVGNVIASWVQRYFQ
ncbi:MAG: alpha/beta hydrolase family protein [Bacteroidota bacterium]